MMLKSASKSNIVNYNIFSCCSVLYSVFGGTYCLLKQTSTVFVRCHEPQYHNLNIYGLEQRDSAITSLFSERKRTQSELTLSPKFLNKTRA